MMCFYTLLEFCLNNVVKFLSSFDFRNVNNATYYEVVFW